MSPESAQFLVLVGELQHEVQEVGRIMTDRERVLEEGEGTFWGPRTGGSILTDFYTGVERMMERVGHQVDGVVPKTPEWHKDLLFQMSTRIPTVRPPLFSEETSRALDDYLKFRHRFHHLYGHYLDWNRIKELLEALPDTWRMVRRDFEAFQEFLRQSAAALRDE